MRITHSFDTHYVNIVKKTSGKAPEIKGNLNNKTLDMSTVKSIIKKYENHSSIININNKVVKSEKRYNIPLATAEQINKIIKKLNLNKATGPDKIPSKIVISANIINSHLANIINHDKDNNSFPEGAKIATVRPIYKKSDRNNIENYRPASISNCFSKVYGRFFHKQFKPFVETFLSGFVAAYREGYSCNHVLMRIIENWKRALDENFQIGAALVDLSKAFDCIPHDLLIAKIYAYGLSEKTTFSHSYLKRRGQRVRIDDILSSVQVLISGVHQGSILGSILFNIFLNDFLEVLTNSDIYNFADDYTISVASKKTLKNEFESAVNWFRNNNVIVNPDKFQLMVLQKSTKKVIQEKLQIDNNEIKSENLVTLLDITIDNQLSFDDHISKLCNKASMQLNAIFRPKKYMSQKELEVVLSSFIYFNFNYCPLVWHFSTNKSLEKLENIHKRCL